MSANIKKGIRNWLQIQPAQPYAINIQEVADYELTAIRNRIWYRGDGNELEQMYQQNNEYADRTKFWASKCSTGMEMRKIHTGLPALMVRILSSIVLADMNDFKFENGAHRDIWENVVKENEFQKLFEKSLKEMLYIGEGAYKIAADTEVSAYPIIEWYPGDRIEYVRSHGRIKEIVFKTPYIAEHKQYVLHEHYGYGYIKNHLYQGEKEVEVTSLQATKDVVDLEFDKPIMLAVPLVTYESTKHEGRGGSIFDGKLDSFDALDEVWSQWMDALRTGRSKEYIPDSLIPRNPNTGQLISPNPFDNRFIAIGSNMNEGASDKIELHQPDIPHESYAATYCTALDLCLQGIISPSTLGIDVKKLDNAEAQREKEKTTLYTRDAIINALQDALPKLVSVCINTFKLLRNEQIENVKVDITFGEYANPSFESQVETVSKARTGQIMSIEASVEELYGDTRDETWKSKEVARLKAEQGIAEVEEPSMNLEGVEIVSKGNIEEGMENASESSKQNISNEPKGIPGAAKSS